MQTRLKRKLARGGGADLAAVLALEEILVLHEVERVAPQESAHAAGDEPAEHDEEDAHGAVAQAGGGFALP